MLSNHSNRRYKPILRGKDRSLAVDLGHTTCFRQPNLVSGMAITFRLVKQILSVF